MIYVFGRLFFPTLINQEKKLRARMKLVVVVCGLILVTGVGVLLVHLNQSRTRSENFVKPFKAQNVPPGR